MFSRTRAAAVVSAFSMASSGATATAGPSSVRSWQEPQEVPVGVSTLVAAASDTLPPLVEPPSSKSDAVDMTFVPASRVREVPRASVG